MIPVAILAADSELGGIVVGQLAPLRFTHLDRRKRDPGS